jgi:hypothetical protein
MKPRAFSATMARIHGSTSSTRTESCITSRCPAIVWPMAPTLKSMRSASQRWSIEAIWVLNCRCSPANPVSSRRRASSLPSWCGMEITMGFDMRALLGP